MHSLLLVLIGFISVFLRYSDGAFACAKSCHCDLHDVVDCSHMGLTKVPLGIPKTARTIHLEGNNITTIKRTDFESFFHLESLYLDGNPIKRYDSYPFDMLIYLNHLVLSMPVIDNKVLHGMDRLEYLEIHGQKSTINLPDDLFLSFGSSLRYLGIHGTGIKSLDKIKFNRLTMLTELNVTGNSLVNFNNTETGLGKLQSLYLSNNSISELSLKGLKRLTHLDASNNMINKLTLAGDLSVLTEIYLSNNRIQNYNYSFMNVEMLDLSFNRISTFQLQSCMIELDISSNPLTTFTTSTTSCMLSELRLRNSTLRELDLTNVNVRTLDLSHNCKLQTLNFSENYKNLAMRDVDMSYCCLTSVNPLLLKGSHIERLVLSNNKISTSDASLVLSVSVKHLDLSNNSISKVQFDGSSDVYDIVDLSSNTITSLKSIGPITIHELNLSSNSLDEDLFKLDQIDVINLDLSHNKFTIIKSKIFFSVLYSSDLHHLDLSYNKIEEIRGDSLFGLQYLALLDLSHNSIAKISTSAFHHMYALTDLSLEGNKLEKTPFSMEVMTHLNHLNLRNNKITKLTDQFFNNMKTLPYLTIDLSGNNLACECEWIAAFQGEFNVHFSITILGNCSYKGHSYEIDFFPHYDAVELVDSFGCTSCSMHHCNYRGDCSVNKKTSKMTCKCQNGYTGHLCETAESICYGGPCVTCNTTYCKNGGRCIEYPKSAKPKCQCMNGYKGDLCQLYDKPEDECSKCQNNATCSLDTTLTLHHTDDDHHDDLADTHHGEDDDTHHSTGHHYTTHHSGDGETHHEETHHEEIHHEDDHHEEITGDICHCMHGYSGKYCQLKEFVSCDSHQYCNNHGKCMMGVADSHVVCACSRGWRGLWCEKASAGKSKSVPAPAKISIIVLALLLVVVVVVFVYIVRKYHICFGSRVRADDQYALGEDF